MVWHKAMDKSLDQEIADSAFMLHSHKHELSATTIIATILVITLILVDSEYEMPAPLVLQSSIITTHEFS